MDVHWQRSGRSRQSLQMQTQTHPHHRAPPVHAHKVVSSGNVNWSLTAPPLLLLAGTCTFPNRIYEQTDCQSCFWFFFFFLSFPLFFQPTPLTHRTSSLLPDSPLYLCKLHWHSGSGESTINNILAIGPVPARSNGEDRASLEGA